MKLFLKVDTLYLRTSPILYHDPRHHSFQEQNRLSSVAQFTARYARMATLFCQSLYYWSSEVITGHNDELMDWAFYLKLYIMHWFKFIEKIWSSLAWLNFYFLWLKTRPISNHFILFFEILIYKKYFKNN